MKWKNYIKKSYIKQIPLCIEIKAVYEETFFVGIVTAYDKKGILFQNINYRGVYNHLIFFSWKIIDSIYFDEKYLKKIQKLMLLHSNNYLPPFPRVRNAKRAFLELIQRNNLTLSILMDGEEINGYITKIEKGNLILQYIGNWDRYQNGQEIIYLKAINYISTSPLSRIYFMPL